jgi:hypothetical protein
MSNKHHCINPTDFKKDKTNPRCTMEKIQANYARTKEATI